MAWELAWVDDNPQFYDSPKHAEAVKRNIEKRYKILELEARIKELEKELE
jgi:hypothetical protein